MSTESKTKLAVLIAESIKRDAAILAAQDENFWREISKNRTYIKEEEDSFPSTTMREIGEEYEARRRGEFR